MKVFFSLIIFSLMLAACQGACFSAPFEVETEDGKQVVPNTCLDRHDGRKHLIGSTWNTAHCFRCECGTDGLHCCHRYGGIGVVEGCTTVVNPVTCKHEHYRIDDPSQPCGV
ncbi:small serum protein 5-like [Pseudonaja textilis]|uniref:small serum protein 5-like n=1 Tax=Pseudonaja textilis TaxID=8673 RepID=UPI000EAABA5E|nr:small serum protein 5-like [Pseudonaja textilis]